MREKGYVYTLIIVMLVLIILSLVSYYIIASQPLIDDVINKMRTDELFYFVEAVKMDYSRSISIAGQRAFAYLIDYSIKNDASFDGYVMQNCTQLNYGVNGSQAAAAELMLCGTLYGSAMLPVDFMENHTLLRWTEKMASKGDELNFIVEVNPTRLEILPYDSTSFYVIGKMDLTIYDRLNQSFYRGYDIPVVSKIEVDTLEDPMYAVRTGNHNLIRYFTPCNSSPVVNSSVLESWLDTRCYLSTSSGPSFFDRLDGNLNQSPVYVTQSQLVEELGVEQQQIGLESFVDLDEFASHNVSVEYNLSWLDHYYWNDIPAYCSVMGMDGHSHFKIDFDHALSYDIKGLNCSVASENSFTPSTFNLPVNATVTWSNLHPAESCILNVNANGWSSTEIIPGERFAWVFNETGTYTMNCTLSPSGGSFKGTIYVEMP